MAVQNEMLKNGQPIQLEDLSREELIEIYHALKRILDDINDLLGSDE